jgi:hypothetical protein
MALISVSNNALQNITVVPASVASGALVLLSTQTASASASISFTSGIDSTYDSYVFKFINIHPSALSSTFQFNLSTDGGSNYNVTKTTTFFRPTHKEDGTDGGITYRTPSDLAQSTAFQGLTQGLGNGVTISNDASASGILTLFNPSSTTYVKHFIAEVQHMHNNDYSMDTFVAGYGNTTSAVNAVRFQMSSGNIDDGIIKLYGVK